MDSFLPLLQQNTERTAQNRGLIKNNSFYFISLAAGLSTIAASIFRKIHANFYAVPTECHQFLPAAVAFAAVLIPEGAPESRNVPESSNKKQPYVSVRLFFGAPSAGKFRPPFLLIRPRRDPRSKNGPLDRFCPPEQAAGTSCSSPDGAPGITFPKAGHKKKALRFRKAFLWCAIGDSNPGPTD